MLPMPEPSIMPPLPESLPAERRRALKWQQANPVASLRQLAGLKDVGLLLAVLASAGGGV